MGQQYSAVGENAVAAATAERKIRGENAEPGAGPLNPAWRKNVSAVVTSLPSHGELISADSSSSHRSKTEGDASRMSIRAAIDSFIENCLSTPTEETTADRSHADLSFSGQNKQISGSSSPTMSNSSSEDNGTAQSSGLSLEVKTNISIKGLKDGPNSSSKNLKDGPNPTLMDLTDGPNSTLNDLKDGTISTLRDMKGEPNSSLKDLKDLPKDLKDGPNSSLKDLKDLPKSPLKDLKVEPESYLKDMKNKVSKTVDKEVFFNCVEQAPSKGTDNDSTDQLSAEPSASLNSKTYIGTQQEGVNECGNENVNNIQKEGVQDNSAEASNTPVEKQIQTSSRTEKQSFSAFLQDRLSRGDFDKREELAQLALSKDIKCQEQMIMWEAVKKPAALSESSFTSYESDGSLLTTGPVRLQTLIDRVLDSSLNNRNSAVTIGNRSGSQVASAASLVEKAGTELSFPRINPSDQCNRISSLEKNASAPNDTRLSFKNHIEKVLMETFLSYEEDERKETSKRESISNGTSMKTCSDSQTSVKECTISVQDLVDQVISQTEMSKLLTPSTRDTSRPASSSSSVAMNKDRSSLASGNESNLKHKAHRVSPQSTALIEAQRHMVQKELQSSTSLGRKRGRPQLHATGSSSSSVTALAKDPSLNPYNEIAREDKSSHLHTRMSPLNYASKGSLPYGISLNMSPLASHPAAAASATTVLQNRHFVAQNPIDLPSSMRTSLPSVSVDYHLHPRESLQPQLERQHASNHAYPELPHSHTGSFLSSSKAAPPPQVSSSQVLLVPHAPTKACSCPICLSHFSQGQNHLARPQHHVHHHLTTQDKAGNASSVYPSISYQPHLKYFKDSYSRQASPGSEAVLPALTASIQGLPSVVTTQHSIRHSLPPSRDVPSAPQLDSHSLSAPHHHHYPHPSQGSVALPDSKFPDAHHQMSKPRIQLDIHGSDFRKLPGTRNPHPGRVEDHKVEAAAAAVYTQPGKDFEQPLDLSVKPHIPSKPEKRACHPGTEATRQDVWDQSRISPYRQSLLDKLPSKQGVASGHHLQRLEKSVDRIVPHGQSQLQDPQYLQQTHLPLHGVKMGSLPPPHETQGEGKHDLVLSESRSLLLEPHDSRATSCLSQSPIIYNQVMIDSPPQQKQQQQQPTLAPPQNSRKLTPSPSTRTYQVTSPEVNQHRFGPAGAASPASQQQSPSLVLDPKQQILVCSSAASVLTHPQNTPSPEDDDGQNFAVSKSEPIQNIIGSHSPTDILYLICRLCRQTYGSPYGFRKHFRNQHGFEPKADHTIVQTISATKTAMKHTEASHLPDETSLYSVYRQEKPVDSSHSSKSPSEDADAALSGLINNPEGREDCKELMKKEMDTKCLECPECGQTFQLNDFGSYKRHCRQHNLHRSYGPFACHDCRKSFAEPQQLREHLLTHSSVTSSLCGMCHTFLSSPDHLTEHLHVAHGHTLGSEEGAKSSPHPYGPESNRLTDHMQTSELGNQSGSPVRKYVSETESAPLTSTSPSSSKFSSLQPAAEALRLSGSSTSRCPSTSKNHHWNRPSPVDPHMFTVHTPKDLEVRKLPADGVVTTASPDSSYDDAKLHLDSQPASSTSQRSAASTEAPTTNGSDTVNNDSQEKFSNSSHHVDKESASNSSDNDSKESTISFPPNKEESSGSFNSKSLTVKALNSNSSSELDEANSFYRHKKYGRHWKRHSVSDGEPSTKSPKLDAASLDHRQSPLAVSSTVNSEVAVQDCQSSSQSSEESSPKLNRPNDEAMKGFENQFCENQIHKLEKKQKNDEAENSSELGKGIVKLGGPSVREFKWDRQTRSQAVKTSNVATHLP